MKKLWQILRRGWTDEDLERATRKLTSGAGAHNMPPLSRRELKAINALGEK
jgi:hypothetical protein